MDLEEFSLDGDDERILNSLSLDDLAQIDCWILSHCSSRWQKVAMVVGNSLLDSDKNKKLEHVPDVIFGVRVEALVKVGKIIARGNVRLMRYSEIKLA